MHGMHGFRHLRTRMRKTEKLEPFPAKTAPKRALDYLMYGVGVLAPLALVPQIVEIFSTKNPIGVSLSTWVLLSLVNLLWLAYGLVHKDLHIVFANVLLVCFHIVIIVGLVLY